MINRANLIVAKGEGKYKLTKRQLEILGLMKGVDGELLTWSKGGGWWIGCEQTSGRTAMILLRFCLVSEDRFTTSNDTYKNYYLNGTGEKALETGYAEPLTRNQ